MKNGNKRGLHNLNNRPDELPAQLYMLLLALAIFALMLFFQSCSPVKGKRIYSERFQFDNAKTVVYENDTALVFTKKRKVVQVINKNNN